MATVPTPLDPTAGDKLSAAAFDAGVRDALNFLLDPPRCEVAMTANTALANNTAALVTWDSEITDNDSMHSTVSNQSRIVIQTAGRYTFNIATNLAAGTATTYTVNLRQNSAGAVGSGTSVRAWSYGAAGGSPRQFTTSFTRYQSVVGDYLELFVTISPAGSLDGGIGVLGTGMQVIWKSLT